jgi:ribosome biogenesis protein Nip4
LPSEEKVVRFKVIGRHEVKVYLDDIASKYNCSFPCGMFDDYAVVEAEGGNFSQIFITSKSTLLPVLLEKGLNVEFVGVSIMKVKGGRVYPQLNMGDIMVKYCKNKVLLPDPLVQKLLYGREITVRERFHFTDGLLVSTRGEFLGFVKLDRTKNGTRIIPEKEIGWYLRSGG